MLKYLLLNEADGLVVEDGPQAMRVSSGTGIQGEVKGHIDGGELVPELLVILQSDTHTHD